MSLFGALFGDAKDADVTSAPNELAAISRRLFEETSPLRQALINRSGSFLGIDTNPQVDPSLPLRRSDLVSEVDRLQQEMKSGRYVDQNLINSLGADAPVGMMSNAGIASQLQRAQDELDRLDAQIRAQTSAVSSATSAPSAEARPFDLTQSPVYAALKSATESQFGRARDSIMSTTPSGGALINALSNLEGQRADTMTKGIGGLAENEMARTFALATGQTPTALGGLGAASSALGNIGMAQAQQQGAAMQGLGMAAGSYLSSGKGASAGASSAGGKGAASTAGSAASACWVAEVLFGINDERTLSIRRYVLEHMKSKTLFGRWCRLYSKRGKVWAQVVRKNYLARVFARLCWSILLRLSK